MSGIYVLGVGPYSIVIAELAQLCGYSVAGFYHFDDSRTGEIYYGIPIISSTEELLQNDLEGINFAMSMGDNSIRSEVSKKIRERGGKVPSLIHPTVEISPSALIEKGVILKRNVSVQAGTVIKKDTVVCDNTVVCHHVKIEEACFIAGMTVVGAYTHIKDRVFIGQGVVIASGKVSVIGKNSVIGAGAVVVNNVGSCSVVYGNPAKPRGGCGQ
jgi:sugar O-acyltransferase (sialic acid O-acetyltransferase NeuD family)